MSTVEAEVLDAKTKEPLPYASVYLTERKDSVITNFTLTDTLGKAAEMNMVHLIGYTMIKLRPLAIM